MYYAHFGLKENPFAITPDPRFLFLSKCHREGIAHLLYGIGESGGFLQLTGEVGTGKTTLYRSVLAQAPEGVDIALVLNPRQTAPELLASICDELHVDYPRESQSIKVLVDALNQHLLRTHAAGRRTIVIIDEAQDLEITVLEQVRLLTNLETQTHKLLRIVLVGQPELQALLERSDLRQLAQRITARFHLTPLTREETGAYVQHRLRRAGASRAIFTAAGLRAVHAASDGVPRLINVICDRALTAAYAEQRERIDTRLVKRAAREVAGRHTRRPLRWALAAGVLPLALVAGLGLAWKILDLPLENPGEVTAYLIDHSQDALPQTQQPGPAEETKVPAETPHPAAQARIQEPVIESPHVEARPANLIERSPEPPAPNLQDLLAAGALATDSVTAFKTLFAYWDQDYSRLSGNAACERALRAGLECLFAQGNLNTLRIYDRPAVLELIDDSGTRHHVTLTGLTRDEAVLDFGGKIVSVPTAQVEASWYGSYVLLWRPPQLTRSVLRVGSRGDDVLWLREQLARVGTASLSGDPSPVFDTDLAESVKRFQQASGLPADGVVGRQTLLRLNSEMSDTPVPLLSARVDLKTGL
jgi:general secretion pathway protein A